MAWRTAGNVGRGGGRGFIAVVTSRGPLLLTSALNLSRSLVALPFAQGLLFRAKHLFVAARIAWKGSAPLARFT